jgi:LytR cell envelope-related transcriptional attenuator
VTRRSVLLLLAAAIAVTAAAVALVARERDRTTPRDDAPPASGLVLLVVRTDDGSLPVVVGRTGFGKAGALVLPPRAVVTVPGQGESTVRDALELPPRQAATALANLLGVWIDHHASIDAERLAAIADETGGVEVGGTIVNGDEVLALVQGSGIGDVPGLEVALEALLAADVDWNVSDLSDADRPAAVVGALLDASGSKVAALEAEEVVSGVFRVRPEQVSQALVDAFGGPAEEAVPVIVLNGNGIPGIGEAVAERLLPGGFRVALSQNAATFDHPETLVVVGSADDVVLAQRVRDLLGVGSVSVSVGSGIAPVTIVVGKDFTG